MNRTAISALVTLMLFGLLTFVPDGLWAQAGTTNPPDFSGVYYPFNPGRGGGGGAAANAAAGGQRGAAPAGGQRAAGPPPPPTRSAPTADLSQGRSPNAPSLTPEYLAKWEIIRKSRMSGSYEYDPIANCLPPGMPQMMNMSYGMEIMQNKDKITFFSEWQDALRRVYLDGRKPTARILNDPTYAGYSTGYWEGDTLVVETVALHPNSFIDGSSPHSEEMTVRERIRFTAPGILEDRITVNDPKALTKPWETVHTYRRADKGNDQLREFACAEGLGHGPK
jgi:hypothetical protein